MVSERSPSVKTSQIAHFSMVIHSNHTCRLPDRPRGRSHVTPAATDKTSPTPLAISCSIVVTACFRKKMWKNKNNIQYFVALSKNKKIGIKCRTCKMCECQQYRKHVIRYYLHPTNE